MFNFSTRPRTHSRRYVYVAACIALSLLAAACASTGSASGPASSGGTIKVGQISTISGGYPFGDTVKGTQAYFKMINSEGGVDGKKISFVYGDDKGTASTAAQLARQFVLQDHVVAMVGNTSLADCNANQGFYQAQHIAVIGGGTEPVCFTQPNWDPVNSGPYVGHIVLWKYLFDVIKPKSVCEIEQNDPTSIPYYNQIRTWYQGMDPQAKFTEVTYTNDATQNPVPAVTAAKQKGCDTIELSTVAPNMVAFRKAEKAVGLDATLACLGSCYDTSVPGTLGSLGDPGALGPKDKGVYVGAELAKVDSTAPQVQQMVKQFKIDHTPADFWSEIGWVSGVVFVNGLKQHKAHGADLTSATGILATLKAMSPINTGFAATDLTFGPGSTHSPNKGGQELLIKNGQWVIAPDQNAGDFMTVPNLPAAKS